MKKIKNYIKNHKTISIVLIIAMIIAIGTAVFLTISYNTEKQRYDAVKAYCNNNDSFAIQTEYELDKQEHELNVNNLVVTSMPNYSSVYNERICVGEYNRSFVGDNKFVADKVKKETYTIRTEVPKNKIWNSFKHIDTPVEISCIDTTAPEFTEKTDTITINKGDKLDVVSKFKATDLSGTVEIKTDSVDVNKVGEQIVNVFATDGSGNVAQTEVKVVVNEPEKQKVKMSKRHKHQKQQLRVNLLQPHQNQAVTASQRNHQLLLHQAAQKVKPKVHHQALHQKSQPQQVNRLLKNRKQQKRHHIGVMKVEVIT